MIESTHEPGPATPPGKILKMVVNPRMGGSVPAWTKTASAKDEIAQNLAQVGKNDSSFKAALSYQMQKSEAPAQQEFGFFDLLDMINPLQHIPLVNLAYRRLTGDEIKSAPQVIGGALFGGPVGAVGGLANVIIKEETGKDIAGNAFGFFEGKTPSFKKHLPDNPETRLADAIAGKVHNDLPVSLLAFTDRGIARSGGQNPEVIITFSPYEIY